MHRRQVELGVRPRFDETGEWRRLYQLLSYAILIIGLLTLVVGAHLIITSYSAVPMWDEWAQVDAVATMHHPPINWLWAQHSEHRVLFYRLLLLADVRLFHGRHWIEFASILLAQTLSFLLLVWLLCVPGQWRGVQLRVGVGIAAFATFCPSQYENFGWAFQISFLLPNFFLLLAIAGLLLYERASPASKRQWWYLCLSVGATGAATYSMPTGYLSGRRLS